MRRPTLKLGAAAASLFLVGGSWACWPLVNEPAASWLQAAAVLAAVVLISVAFHDALATYRGIAALLLAHLLIQVWLQWQWGLWDASNRWLANANQVAILVLAATVMLLLVNAGLLMVHRDASRVALAMAWIGWPVLMIAMTARFGTLAGMEAAAARDLLIPYSLTCLLGCLLPMGLIAFFGHLGWLVVQEIAGRE